LGLENAVTLHPAYTQQEAVALYQSAHVLLHPKFNDPCPTVVIEAMACGLPVIGSASGGMPELVGEEGGRLLTPPEQTWETLHPPDPDQMAGAVVALMQSWPIHSQAARARAERLFNKELWVERHRAVFERLTNQ
jgi:glycosyltransferase involved in cell wall biosynthesis